MRQDRNKFGKIMLVFSAPADDVERCFRGVARKIVKVVDGEARKARL